MTSGSTRCVDTPQALKQRFGQGYLLTLDFVPYRAAEMRAFIDRCLNREAQPTDVCLQTAKFEIGDDPILVSRLFVTMHSESRAHGITHWGISQGRLNDVFMHVVADKEVPS
eukprot:CAMPEP_0119336632 /NCGR_PEP_ID=MMETSP1333-20130426/92244_1 /TAXON_ID=418940 /ORGANISM="Scyphosphaera apsteinii, Strain RCC1455" /LENGTH=111 /DNA_ID=CAMNT_0007347475 /DNA_START=118 /DNA_END=453 /DNA_ORIENTATION=+